VGLFLAKEWTVKTKWVGLPVFCCMSTTGMIGPQGYEQSTVKYKVDYLDAAKHSFLPDDWALDNYSFDAQKKVWTEKKGDNYRATRELDENGDGSISGNEKSDESIFDLRFVNVRDNAVIWLKVHPLALADSQRDLEVILDNYADGLSGTGLFEQSSLFGLRTDQARHYTTFIEKKEGTDIGPLGAILGVIEIAEVEKLRLDSSHRDSKAELIFAKVRFKKHIYQGDTKGANWPTTEEGGKIYQLRTGLLVIGYYDTASRFDSHLADFNGLLARVHVPSEALLPDNARPKIHDAPAPPAPAAPAAPASTSVSSAPATTGENAAPAAAE